MVTEDADEVSPATLVELAVDVVEAGACCSGEDVNTDSGGGIVGLVAEDVVGGKLVTGPACVCAGVEVVAVSKTPVSRAKVRYS